MKINKFFSGVKYKLEHRNRRVITSKLCGVTITTTPYAIRKKVDQDDSWFFYLSKHNNVVFDIGCNVGYTALLAMIQNPYRDYLLVDPNPNALNEAHFNLTNNNLGSKAYYYSGFVSNKNDDEIKFYTLGSGEAGSMYASHAKSASAVNSFTKVNTVTLDYLYKFYELKPDLVKIDVEGAECLVMEGATQLAKETECTFFIEMHEVEDMSMEQAAQFMIDWCHKANYVAWYLKTGEQLKQASTIKNRGKCHLLLLSKSIPYPTYLSGIQQNADLPNEL